MHYPADAIAGLLVGSAIVYLVVDVSQSRDRMTTPDSGHRIEAREREPEPEHEHV
jgi:membrane-associated phospholipid phosphatase